MPVREDAENGVQSEQKVRKKNRATGKDRGEKMNELIDFILALLIADTLMIFIPAGVLALIARMIAERWEK